MSLWVCDPDRGGCTTRYSVGAPHCPHCGETAAYELGDDQRRDVRAGQEGDTSSPGSSSKTSSPKPEISGGPSSPPRPKRARTAASPSRPARKAASTAGSTATSGPATAGPNSADGAAGGAAGGGGSG